MALAGGGAESRRSPRGEGERAGRGGGGAVACWCGLGHAARVRSRAPSALGRSDQSCAVHTRRLGLRAVGDAVVCRVGCVQSRAASGELRRSD